MDVARAPEWNVRVFEDNPRGWQLPAQGPVPEAPVQIVRWVGENVQRLERLIESPTGRKVTVGGVTRKMVSLDGPAGRKIVAAHYAKRVAAGRALPVKGVYGRGRVLPATPTGVPYTVAAYTEQLYRSRENPRTLTDWAKVIHATIKAFDSRGGTRHLTAVATVFENVQGERIFRNLDMQHAGSVKDILAQVKGFAESVPAEDSDPVPENTVPITSDLILGWFNEPAGGARGRALRGPDNPYFKLVDAGGKDAAEGDCLLAQLRYIAALKGVPPVPFKRNASLRAALGLPPAPAPIAASAYNITTLAKLFGLRIHIVTGMRLLPDSERTYDDDGKRYKARNRCLSEPVPETVQLVGEGQPADIYLDVEGSALHTSHASAASNPLTALAGGKGAKPPGHYMTIAAWKPLKVCPITGDWLSTPPAPIEAIRARVLEQGRPWHGIACAAEVKNKRPIVVFYDYETVYGPTGRLEPYALGYVAVDPNKAGNDFSALAGTVSMTFGADVTKPLLDLIASAPADVRYQLVSFNGCRFDHFILAREAGKRRMLNDVFATTGAGLRSVRIGRHSTLDVAKLLPAMSLKSACQAFQTQPKKVDGFHHSEPQMAYESGTLPQWIEEHRAKLTEYLAGDVLSLASLYQKLRPALLQVTGLDIVKQHCPQTIGGLAWEMMTQRCPIPPPVKDEALDKTIRSAIVGGRVQVYGRGPVIVKEPLRMLDVASLYPTAMAAPPKARAVFEPRHRWGVYPSGPDGEPEAVPCYTRGDVGIWRTTISRQPTPAIIPRRVKDEPLDWSPTGEFEAWITHCDIELIREYGGACEPHEGYRWVTTTEGLFAPFIASLAAAKDREDALSAAKDPTANPALRAVYKLLMNSASGKCVQRNFDDRVQLVTGAKAMNAARRTFAPDTLSVIGLHGDTALMVGKKPADTVYGKTAKPAILAVLIYSYSRAYFYKTMGRFSPLYGDTDSGLFRVPDYEQVRAAYPALNPAGRKKELGDLEEELGPHTSATAYLIAPKEYAVFLRGGPAGHDKIRAKGVNVRTDRLIAPAALPVIEAMTMQEYTAEYASEATDLSVPLADDLEGYFEARAENRPMSILCSQLTRSLYDKDTRKVFVLRQRYLIKEFGTCIEENDDAGPAGAASLL